MPHRWKPTTCLIRLWPWSGHVVVVGVGGQPSKVPSKLSWSFHPPPLPLLFGYRRNLQGEFPFSLPLLLPFLVIVYLRHHLLWLSVFNPPGKELGPPVLKLDETLLKDGRSHFPHTCLVVDLVLHRISSLPRIQGGRGIRNPRFFRSCFSSSNPMALVGLSPTAPFSGARKVEGAMAWPITGPLV